MKKLSAILVGMSLVAGAVMAAGPVTSVNAVGYAKRTLPPGKLILCSLGFSSMSTNSIDSVFAGQLSGALDSSASDALIKWNPVTQKYENAWKVDGSGLPEYDGKWFIDDGEFPPNPSPMTFSPGEAFWIQSKQVATQEVVFSGEVPNGVISTNNIVNQMNFVSYPYSAAVGINDPTNGLAACAAGGLDSAVSDALIMWDELAQKYVFMWLVQGSGEIAYDGFWFYDDGEFPPNLATNTLQVCQGLWFRRKAGTGTKWITARPYSL
jgi:hypothetical protein